MNRRVGVLLSGCGAYDGSDPHEAVLVTLALQEAGLEPLPLAMDRPQFHVVDHATGLEAQGETRGQFAEACRLVRGKLFPLSEVSPKLLDALVIPGGQGAVKSLLGGFGTTEALQVDEEVRSFLTQVSDHGAWLAAISLAEFVLAAVLGPWPEGGGVFDLKPTEVFVDRAGRRLLAPGNLLCNGLPELHTGMRALARTLSDVLGGAAEEGQ
jgi:enhancing lycopene biosynthesis protein 2